MPEQQLDYAQVLGLPVDQGRLGTSHRVGAVRRVVKPDLPHPAVRDPSVLASRDVRGALETTRKQIIIRSTAGFANL